MKIIAVEPDSPLFGRVRKGYKLLRINSEPVRDRLDYIYGLSEESVDLEFKNARGETVICRLDNDYQIDLGLRFQPDKIRTCRNKCIFCFIHQQPKGMRRALYIKDDDFCLSFTHGNFITLSNLTDDDIKRIVKQRLTPLYVSVHTTDDNLRRSLFGSKKLPAIIPRLKYFIDKGIQFHTQVVLCPGINDGDYLEKTIDDLFKLYPGILTLGIIPVGLTRYREKLPGISPYDASGAELIINYVHRKQKEFLRNCGTRFVFAADEFYVLAERDFPRLSEYEDMAQFENGIGMMRSLITDFNRRKRFIRRNKKGKKVAVLTGEAAGKTLRELTVSNLKKKTNLEVDVFPLRNRFWGRTVTVSGLLTGRDILAKIKKIENNYDIAILPPNCLNDDNLFLDDLSLEQLRKRTGIDIMVGSYSLVSSLRKVLN